MEVALPIIHSLFAVIHVLAGAAWLGAMIYSFFILHAGAKKFFRHESDFEAFITTVSHGTRWKVILGFSIIGVSGLGLILTRWPEVASKWWMALLAGKLALFVAAVVLFVHVSWRMWPARVFATAEEYSQVQRTFRRVAAVMIAIAGLGIILGVLACRVP